MLYRFTFRTIAPTYQDAATDEYVDISEICRKLSQKWMQKICQDKAADKFFGLRLQRFWLIQEDKFEIISDKIGSVTKSLFARIKKANIKDNTPIVQCEIGKEKSPFGLCDVAVKLDYNLLAVWVVVSNENDKAFLAKQVRAIKAFIEHAIGDTEDIPAFYENR